MIRSWFDMRRAMVRGFGLVLLLPVASSAQDPSPELGVKNLGAPRNPNILYLIADDLGVDMVGAYGVGGDLPPTPIIDALAARGLLFRNAWSNPLCSPTRATLQTGKPAFLNGIGWLVNSTNPHGFALRLSELILPELLDMGTNDAYAHAAIGKWHLGNASVGGDEAPNLAGYSHFSGTPRNFISPSNYFSWPKVVNGVRTTSNTYATTDSVDSALSWIDSAQEPWLAYVAFNAPHRPFHAPPANLHSIDLTNPTDRKFYKAAVQALDTEIGRLLDGLGPATRANTMVVFLGDNGTPNQVIVAPFDNRHGKLTLYQGGVNVPLIIAGPLVRRKGAEVQALVSTTDLFTTIGDMAGVDWSLVSPERPADSVSLVPYFMNPGRSSLRAHVYSELFQPNGIESPPPAPPCPVLPVCQNDIGYGGPGSSTLSVCGEELYGGYLDSNQDGTLLIQNAPPGASGVLFIGRRFNPTPMFGGTIAAWPAEHMSMITSDASGNYSETITPDPFLGPGVEYYQAIFTDPAQPGGYIITNAVEVEALWTDCQALRDARYTLIVNNPKCREAFHDLQADPFEQTNLLQAGMTPEQESAYLALRQTLAQWKN